MAEQTQEMQGLVECITRPLVANKDDLEVVATEVDDTTILVEIRAHEEDIGKIIGRQGRIIKSIRTLTHAATARTHMHVKVEIAE